MPSKLNQPSLPRRVAAEVIGTAFLLAAIVGSGIMAERMAGGNAALALLANSTATGAALMALILTFGSVSGAHFNPVVTLADAWQRGIAWRDVSPYIVAQIAGAVCGVVMANLMFELSPISMFQHPRNGYGQWIAEFVAAFGLLSVVWGAGRLRTNAVAFAVAAYIAAAYWFTSSTSFANPAVTVARALTGTFAGIRVADVPAFVICQCAGAAAATLFFGWLVPPLQKYADEVILAHDRKEEHVG
jgi:glycerol uptake facilitator-like aquaporin